MDLVNLENFDLEKLVWLVDLMNFDGFNLGIFGLFFIDYVLSLDFGSNEILNKD